MSPPAAAPAAAPAPTPATATAAAIAAAPANAAPNPPTPARATANPQAQLDLEDERWAASCLQWLRHERQVASERRDSEITTSESSEILSSVNNQVMRLYPPGRILWRLPAHVPAYVPAHVPVAEPEARWVAARWVVADHEEFDELVLVGSQMVTSHLPNAYARALFGDASLALAHS
eukprot:CAMPEP_0174706544 /NCGR_PEP_ID=MMETSP1094-20130205/9354_1 /TAXON_ID=156173 /ORGANISM="Chrysochromulina brevifilum, Strain UTEX LB 985" /LENGTH=176 /DNA_ID=CAMNT_0015904815 /DNA_START=45 /DNA_END=575 /DNA_ORIENTATION=-